MSNSMRSCWRATDAGGPGGRRAPAAGNGADARRGHGRPAAAGVDPGLAARRADGWVLGARTAGAITLYCYAATEQGGQPFLLLARPEDWEPPARAGRCGATRASSGGRSWHGALADPSAGAAAGGRIVGNRAASERGCCGWADTGYGSCCTHAAWTTPRGPYRRARARTCGCACAWAPTTPGGRGDVPVDPVAVNLVRPGGPPPTATLPLAPRPCLPPP